MTNLPKTLEKLLFISYASGAGQVYNVKSWSANHTQLITDYLLYRIQ